MNLGEFKAYRFLAFILKLNWITLFKPTKKVYYFDSVSNFGDKMNVDLIKGLTDDKVDFISSTEFYLSENYLVIGSVLQVSNKNSIVWGSGLHFNTSGFYYDKPKKVLAVRGPLTRKNLLSLGVDCPEVYGDPALLLPGIFMPSFKKNYKLGIVPHYFNQKDECLNKYKDRSDIIIINVKDEPKQVVELISQCQYIISSSLHGLIIADAYKIPNLWITFSKAIGIDNFKFNDYFLSVGRSCVEPIAINDFSLEETYDMLGNLEVNKIQFDPLSLLNVSPFTIKNEVVNKLLKWYKI